MMNASKGQNCPPIDQDHEVLFSLVEELEGRVNKPVNGQDLDQLVVKLRAYLDAHFENEEAFMRQTKYPGAESHIAAHKEFLEYLQALAAQVDANQNNKAAETVSILKRWLIMHIDGTDSELAKY